MAFLTTMAWVRRIWAPLHRWIAWLPMLALLSGGTPILAAEAAPSAEYQLKAVFLFNFAQFVEWPATAFREANSPLIIGVLGENPFGSYLGDLVRDEKVGDRPILVRRYQRPEDITDCHILFVSASEAGALDKIVTHLKGRSILTVGDVDTFNRQGGMVRFLTEEGKIRLRINIEIAKACQLTISSKILRPDMIVAPAKN
jgi:hypothetical protein